jgi:hypothetical protein
MASPNVSEVMTMSLESRTGKLADNVSKNNAILDRLTRKDKMRTISGGRVIYQELEYAENSTFKRYSGYETLNISPSDVFTSAEFNIKQAAVAVSVSGLEELQNAGKERVIELVESRVGNAERTFKNNISSDMYSDGTANGGKQIGGLQLLIADAPTTGTVGGINRATWSFWQNQLLDASVEGAAVSATNIQKYMNTLWLRCARGPDYPDLIIADNVYYQFYWESLQSIQRITQESTGEAGFMTLKYMNADVVYDGGYGGNAPASHMYFLNCDYIHWRPHEDRNMVPLNPDRFATNQDAVVKLIGFAGNCTMSNAFVQGVMHE